jgi:hypothetical protein
MVFKLFSDVKKCEVIPYLEGANGLNFQRADIWVDVDSKKLLFDADNRRYVVNFDGYDKLLSAIIGIARELYSRDMINALGRARDLLTTDRRYPQLEMGEREVVNLLSAIERAKDHLLEGNFTLKMKLRDIEIKDVDGYIKDHPEIERTIRNGIEHYRELCWKSGGEDCDHVMPTVYMHFYAIPEEKRIGYIISLDRIIEVYEYVKGYDDAHSFLKALEEVLAHL